MFNRYVKSTAEKTNAYQRSQRDLGFCWWFLVEISWSSNYVLRLMVDVSETKIATSGFSMLFEFKNYTILRYFERVASYISWVLWGPLVLGEQFKRAAGWWLQGGCTTLRAVGSCGFQYDCLFLSPFCVKPSTRLDGCSNPKWSYCASAPYIYLTHIRCLQSMPV